MKNKKLKKNSFIQGTIVASFAFILIKIIGALYVIPFYKIVGEDGGTLYSYAYNIYNLFLNISTAGIPIAISMIISEYLALEMYEAKERSYKIGKYIVSFLAIVSFLIVFFGSNVLARFIMSDVTGGHTIESVSLVIKSISFCLLIIPFLSITRGYLQGHKYIVPTTNAQIIEQVVRIAIAIIGSYITIRLFNLSVPIGVCVALSGTFLGGLFSYIYLKVKISKNSESFPENNKTDNISNKKIILKIIYYCIPFIVAAITDNLYTLIDIKFIIKGLSIVGFDSLTAETISSILSTWAPKICAVIGAITVALTTNIIPHITSSYVCNKMDDVNDKVNQAISTALVVTIPAAILIYILSNEAYFIFYGNSLYGWLILKLTAIINIFFGVSMVLNSCLQSMKKFKYMYISTAIGLIINTVLDIPMILLLDKLSLPSYIGTSIATCIGYIISIIFTIYFLKKKLGFNFKNSAKVLKKMFIPLLCLCLSIIISKSLIRFEYNYISAFISLLINGMIGAFVYLFMIYRNGIIYEVFGQDNLKRLLLKLHIKK